MQHGAWVVPVEADRGSLALQLHRSRQRRLPRLDAREQRLRSGLFRRTPRRALGLLLRLDALPRALDSGGLDIAVLVGEHMRMPADQFSGDRLDHVAKGKRVLLL